MIQKYLEIYQSLLERQDEDLSQFEHEASVAIIFKMIEGRLHILFIKRSEKEEDPWSGHMAFPGGRREKDDQTRIDVALRETMEEVGLNLSDETSFLGELPEMQARKRGAPLDVGIKPYVFYKHGNDNLVLDPNEVQAIHWIPVDHFMTSDNFDYFPFGYKDYTYSLPAVKFQEELVWGLSYIMLGELFKILSGENYPHEEMERQFKIDHWLSYPGRVRPNEDES